MECSDRQPYRCLARRRCQVCQYCYCRRTKRLLPGLLSLVSTTVYSGAVAGHHLGPLARLVLVSRVHRVVLPVYPVGMTVCNSTAPISQPIASVVHSVV